MDDLDLLHDPDGAATAPLARVAADPLPGPPAGPPGYDGPGYDGPGYDGPGYDGPGYDGPGTHRRAGGPPRPWAWLAAVLVAALVAVGGVLWMIGAAVSDGDARPAPIAARPSATATPSPPAVRTAEPTYTPAPTPTPTSRPVPSATRPVPSVTSVVAPPPAPTSPGSTAALVRVPNVVGDRLKTATRTLESAGFKVSVLSLGGAERDNRRVLLQRPAGGLARSGSTVVLYVGGG